MCTTVIELFQLISSVVLLMSIGNTETQGLRFALLQRDASTRRRSYPLLYVKLTPCISITVTDVEEYSPIVFMH